MADDIVTFCVFVINPSTGKGEWVNIGPNVPTKMSELVNDVGMLTPGDVYTYSPVKSIVGGANVTVVEGPPGTFVVSSTGGPGGGAGTVKSVTGTAPIHVIDPTENPAITVDSATTTALGVVRFATGADLNVGNANVVVTADQWKLLRSLVPSKVSQLTNDASYVTLADVNSQLPVKTLTGGVDVSVAETSPGVWRIDSTYRLTSVDWAIITNKPAFHAVATSGDYLVLKNQPTIPAPQVQTDWNATTGMGVILNKPGLGAAAISNSYNDLDHKPTIPTQTSQLLNDSGFINAAEAAAAAPVKNIVAGTGIAISDDGAGVFTVANTGSGPGGPGGSVTSVSGVSPVNVLNGTTTPVISVAAASQSNSGIVRLADPASIAAGTATRVVDAAQLKAVKDTIPAAYTLPTASATVLGGVKVGSNLAIASGVLSATVPQPGTTMPVAPSSSPSAGSSSAYARADHKHPLPTFDGGTVAAPGISFTSATGSGLFSTAATHLGATIGGLEVLSVHNNPLPGAATSVLSAPGTDVNRGSISLERAKATLHAGGYEIVLDASGPHMAGNDYPITQGNPGQLLMTNGRGHLSWSFAALENLSDTDVHTNTPTAGQALTWNATDSKWVPGTIPMVIPAGGTPSTPTLAVVGDPDTGIFSNTANSISTSVGGILTFASSYTGTPATSLTTLTAPVTNIKRGTVQLVDQSVSITAGGSTVKVDSTGATITGNLYPTTQGTAGQVLQTNGSGTLSWESLAFAIPAGGTNSSPGLAVVGDPDTGIYSNTANSISTVVGGMQAFTSTYTGTPASSLTTLVAPVTSLKRGTIQLVDELVEIRAGGGGSVKVDSTGVTIGYNLYPTLQGNPGQFLMTNGRGTLSWTSAALGELSDVDVHTTAPTAGQTLIWHQADPTVTGDTSKWLPGTISSGFTCADGTTKKTLDDVADFLRVFAGCSANQPLKIDGSQATGWEAVALKSSEYIKVLEDGTVISFDPEALVMIYDTTRDTSGNLDVVLPINKAAVNPNVEIDWGDGTTKQAVTVVGNVSHTYAKPGRYVVSVKGTMDRWGFAADEAKNVKVERCLSWGKTGLVSLEGAFRSASKMNAPVPAPPKTVTSMAYMFNGCTAFNQSVSNFDTAAVTNMYFLFSGCAAFNQSVSRLDTAAVTNMGYMFSGCASFNQPVSNFDTAAATYMHAMFNDCASFNQPVSNFNTAAVTSMGSMFRNCTAFNQPLSNFDTAEVTNMGYMFKGCAAFDYDISHFSTRKLVTTTSSAGLDEFMDGARAFSTANLDKLLKAWDAAKAGNASNNHRPKFATACSGAGGGAAARDNLLAAGWTFTMPADLP